jgi:putative flippase GtrA
MVDLRRESHQFLRFGVVGAAGFIADAGLLALLHYGIGLNPLAARVLSAPLAVLLTFILNQSWGFSGGRRSLLQAMALYLTVQGVGFLSNFAVYSIAITLMPLPLNEPIMALVVASAAALAVNYVGSRFIVFNRHPRKLPETCEMSNYERSNLP